MKSIFNLFSIALIAVSVTLVSCGGEESDDGTDDATTETNGGDVSSASESAEKLYQQQVELSEVILAIESVDDIAEADPKVKAVFERMAASIKNAGGEQAATKALQSDSRAKELDTKMQAHLEKIGAENPELAAAIGELMMKHSRLLMEAVGDKMGDMEKEALESAGKALDDAKDKANEESGK